MIGYIGTYDKDNSEGLYSFKVDNKGILSNLSVLSNIPNSKYISLNNDLIFSIYSSNTSGIVVLNKKGEVLSKLAYEPVASCHLYVDNNVIYTSNYHTGIISKLKYTNKVELLNTYVIENKCGSHQIIKIDNYIYVPCLNLDCITVFDLDLKLVKKIDMPKNSGPRHAALSKDNKYLYVIGELSNKVYAINTSTNQIENEIMLSNDGNSKSSAIRISNDGKFLYTSTRVSNTINVISISGSAMSIDSTFNSLGDETRDILNILNDKYLLVANVESGSLISFSLETKKQISKLELPSCCSIVVGEINE